MNETSVNATVSGGAVGVAGGQVVRIENLYVGTAASTEPAKPSEPIPSCPYPGLAYFGPQEASRFFGREHAIRKLVAALAKRGFTALVGASGSGKSSVVLAGLAPRLDALGGWRSTYFRIGTEPDKNPFAALARALEPLTGERGLSDKLEEVEKLAQKLATGSITLTNYIGQCRAANPGKRVLLIADQFEETFTFVPDEVLRNRFIDGLIEAFPDPELGATPDICLVLTLRADFYNAALHHRPLSDRLQDHVENLGPMTRQELRDAIEKPADAAHVGFEPGLVDTILTDVEKRPGSLPLLQFALREMWGRLKTPVMTHSDYDAIGRVEGALAQRAQSIFMDATKNETDASSVALFRHLFTRLVTLGEGAEDTRRIVGREELGRDAWALAQKLAGEDNRLVVTAATTPGQETAEVAHEALIRNWPALVDWVDRDRAFISWRNQLSQRLDDWRKSPSDEGTLLRGGSLGVAEGWLARRGDDLSEDEMTFVARSVGLRDAEMRQAERIRKDKEAIRRANFQLAVALVGLFFAVVLGLALFELRRHALLKGEIKRLVSTAQAASTETNREPLLLFLSATYEADSDVWAVDKEPILRALIKRLDSSPREVGRYSAVAFDANNARLAWIPSGGLDGDYMYVCSLLRGHNCDMTAENKQQKIVQEYKVPKPIQESANPMLMGSSFIPLMGFIDGLKLPIIIKNGILYYLPAGVSGVEWQNDDPWRMLDLAEIIGQRGDLGWIRFDIEGGVIEVLDQDWKNLKQRMGRIEYLAEKGFVYSDLTLKIEWDTVGSLIPVAAPGGQFGAALVSSLANPPVSKPLGDCLEVGSTGRSAPGPKFPVSIELWKAAPRSVELPEMAQVAVWCDSASTQIRGGVGFSNGGDFVAALFQKRLRVYPTSAFGPEAKPAVDAKLTGISSEQLLANGPGFTFGPLALHRTKDASFQVAWANRGVRLLTAPPKEPELNGSTAQSLTVPFAGAAVKLKFDDEGHFLFRQDLDVSTRQLIASVWDLRKDWTDYVEGYVKGRISLNELKNFVCSIASDGSSVGNDHVSYTVEERIMLGWDESTDRHLADPCAPN